MFRKILVVLLLLGFVFSCQTLVNMQHWLSEELADIFRSDFLFHFSQVSAWGGYVFIINLIPLHVFVLLLMQRYSRRVYIGKLCSLNNHCQMLNHEI